MKARLLVSNLVCMLIAAAPSWANSHDPLELKSAQEVAKKIDQNKRLINEQENKQRQVLANLFEINQKIKKISREKSELESERQILEVSILDLKIKIDELKGTLLKKGRALTNHIRIIQETQGFAWLNLFSSSQGPAEMDLNIYIFSKLAEKEKDSILEYFEEKTQLQRSQKKLQGRLDRMTKVSEELQMKQQEFQKEQSGRSLALNGIRSQKKRIIEKMKRLRHTELVQRLEDTGLLDSLSKASFLEEKGSLISPAKGVLKQRFGIVKLPEATYYKNHKGIFIQTKAGQDIRAVFSGKVAYVGTVGGFGKTLVLDHGDHYYTVYSSVESIAVTEGQLVGKSDPIGQVGTSDFYSENGIYFEVRHFSEPQNPLEWLTKGTL